MGRAVLKTGPIARIPQAALHSRSKGAASLSYSILGTPGFIRNPDRYDDADTLRALGANSGNLVFQYACSLLVDAPLTHIGMTETPYSDVPAVQATQKMIVPAANHLRADSDWTGLNNFLSGINKPLIVMGLGAQSPKIGGTKETLGALRSNAQVMRLVDILRDRAEFITVRGDYTQTVCYELGLKDVHVLGCPSAMINPDPGLGRGMDTRLRLARDGMNPPRIAVTAAAPFEIRDDPPKRDIEQQLFRWVVATDGLYVQQSGGIDAMRAANGRWYEMDRGARASISVVMAPNMEPLDLWAFMAKGGRFYTSANHWREDMRDVDVCMGTRLHGNMAAIAAGTPGVIIAHDSRTGELGQTMHLPSLDIADAMAAGSVQEALGRVTFDGTAFDTWRRQTARSYEQAFTRMGIPIATHIKALAGADVPA